MTSKYISLGTAAALVALSAPLVASQTTEDTSVDILAVEDAVAIALEAQPGEIGEAELDTFEGRPAYDIEIINDAGEEIEFKIDAETGDILHRWTDDDPDNDPVSKSQEEALD